MGGTAHEAVDVNSYVCSVIPDGPVELEQPSVSGEGGATPPDLVLEETRNGSVVARVEEEQGKREDSSRGGGYGLPLPLQVVERNRLSVAEIRALPRFKDYSAGEPSNVRSHPLALSLF